MRGSFSRILIWFTRAYWGRLVEFLKLLGYIRSPRRWYEIRDWHSRECRYMHLKSIRFLLDELVAQGWVNEYSRDGYVLSELGREQLDEFLDTVKCLLADFEPPKSRTGLLKLLVKSSWFRTPRTSNDVADKLGVSRDYASRVLKRMCEAGVLKRKRTDRVGRPYVYYTG